jgi:hypothetical protein
MLTERTSLLAKTEATYGTDATPAGTDGVLAMNIKPDVRFQSLIRNVQKATIGNYAPVSETSGNAAAGGISFDVELRGAGSAYSTAVKPKISPLLQACGLTETVSSGTSVTYAPASTGINGCTIYAYLDGIIAKLVGCRGNVKLALKAGAPATLTFDMQALTIAFTDGALVAGTYEPVNTAPPTWLKYSGTSALKIGTGNYEPIVQNLTLDLGNNVQISPSANSANGRAEIFIAARDIGGTFDPELVTEASFDYEGAMLAATQMAGTAQVGITQWNRAILTMPKLVLGQIGHQDRNGRRALSIPFKCAENAGDDEISLVFS